MSNIIAFLTMLFLLIRAILCPGQYEPIFNHQENDSVTSEKKETGRYTSGDFSYIAYDDWTATVYLYSGDAEELTFPEVLDGYDVIGITGERLSDGVQPCISDKVKKVTIPDSVTDIGELAFATCSSLSSIVIPDSVTSIGDYAFGDCNALEYIYLPETITFMGKNPFLSCDNLVRIEVPFNSYLATIEGVLYSKPDKRLICYPGGLTNKIYSIPYGVRIIGECAFAECASLETVEIPDGITNIEAWAFSSCTGLTSITIPDQVTQIEEHTFAYCESLKEIIIPDSVTSIGQYAFFCCESLSNAKIPASVINIGDYAFYWCTSLLMTVPANSYAEQYCIDNGISYTY